MTDLLSEIDRKLREAFSPLSLTVENETHLHAGHAGAAEHVAEHGNTPSHIHIEISAPAFADMSRLQRHRAVMGAIDAEVAKLHAVRLTIGGG